jgi:hypothetical protein
MKPPHHISIEFLDVGALVIVGCKRLAYTDLQQMLVNLAAYVNNPAETIKVMQEEHPELKEERRRNSLIESVEENAAKMAAQGLNGLTYQ